MTLHRLWRNLPHLKDLKKSSAKKRRKIISSAPPELINTLCDCCLNATSGTLKLSEPLKKKLKRHAPAIRALSKKKQSVKKRRQILLQKGGFLPLLIAPILGLVLKGLLGNG